MRIPAPYILMSKPRRNTGFLPLDDILFAVKQRTSTPHEFVLDAIAALSPETRSMFGCLAVYVEDKIVLILRDKRDATEDNGVWLATTEEHHQSLRREFPNMRSIRLFGKKGTGWSSCSISIRSLRTEYSTWSSNARNNFSGAIDGRPVLAYNL